MGRHPGPAGRRIQQPDPGHRLIAERWSEDVSEDVARELQRRCDLQMTDVPSALAAFVDRCIGDRRQLSLRLVSR
ncbi:hypothetical protein [Bradyrhizobium septentrionale]|uniref:Uncharacterized protein n=1 Tax=Bradyrhizobium septentrionale TaxID=1404411 RepID=A0ABZ2PBN6_9BRAD